MKKIFYLIALVLLALAFYEIRSKAGTLPVSNEVMQQCHVFMSAQKIKTK